MAEELQLKGLMGSGAEGEAEDNVRPPAAKKKLPKQVPPKSYFPPEAPAHETINKLDKVETSPSILGTVAATDFTVAADLQDLDDKIKSMMETTDRTVFEGNQNRTVIVCKVCGKEGAVGDIKKHIESNHITGVSHTCNICGKISRSRNALGMHKSTYHKL